MHIFVTNQCIGGYLLNALWSLLYGFIFSSIWVCTYARARIFVSTRKPTTELSTRCPNQHIFDTETADILHTTVTQFQVYLLDENFFVFQMMLNRALRSALVQVIARSRKITSYYLTQYTTISVKHNYVAGPQWPKMILETKLHLFTLYILMVFSLEAKHRHAVNNCALTLGHISAGREMLFGSQRSWNQGPSHNENNSLTPNLVDHRTENATEPWTKIKVRMAPPVEWTRFEH